MTRTPCEFAPLGLDEAACRLLSPARGMLEAPIRSVLFGSARFSEHGRSLAQAQEVAGRHERPGTFFPRLAQNLAVLRDSRAVLEAHAAQGHHLTPAAGWLIDHGRLLDSQFETVQKNLPRSYFQKLPRLRDEPLAGLPRIYGLAWAWVAHADSGMDEDLLELFLAAYQSQRELTLAELWAIPTTLRVVLIENLRRLAERAATSQAARDAAHRWMDRQGNPAHDGRDDMAWLERMGQALAARDLLEVFALQLQRRSEDGSASLKPAIQASVRAWLATRLPDPVGALQRQQQMSAEDHQSVRNAVTSLRELDRADWRGVLLRSSAALADLQRLPVFQAESDETQDLSLHDIERLARRAGVPESSVSAALARLALPAIHAGCQPASGPAASAPQYWLRGPGRARLLRELKLHDTTGWLQRGARRVATPAYLITLATATAAVVAAALRGAAAPQADGWALAVTAFLLAWPASEAVVAVLHRLISESLRPCRLPRLAWDDGIPPSHRVLVVMPVMLTQETAIQEMVEQLEQHHLANPERHAQFALLSDHGDAATEHVPTDAHLLAATRQALTRLNQRHALAAGQPARFLLLHRPRRWSDSEQCWMGWERKRGKLETLVAWLAQTPAGKDHPLPPCPFEDMGSLSAPAGAIRSVVTLDSDTGMPPGRLRELASIAAHPLNTPHVQPENRRVTAGYAILQPRVVAPLPSAGPGGPGVATPFHWMFSGQWGVDPYSAASSEIYQDLFCEGTYTGKGLLDVQAVHATLSHRLPDAQVLSHDLLEGSLARCATVSDVTLVEDTPVHPDVAASRLHRWTRGDWQLLPFLLQPARWPMAGINRWKMFDNLRRSLVAPMSLGLLLWVIASGDLAVWPALWLVAAAYGAGPLLGAVAALAPPRDDISLSLFYRRTGSDLARALAGTLWHGVQLLSQALMSLDAIARATVRQFHTRRLLLQWTTAAAAQAAARTDLPSLVRRHRALPAVSGLLLAVLLAGHLLGVWHSSRTGLMVGVVLCLLWAAAPMATWVASRALPARTLRLSAASRESVRGIALDTWGYYARYVGPASHHLPPDNVQMTGPEPMIAHRTSPTNIGLYLLATAAACEMDLISDEERLERLELTLNTLDCLPRWRGHFYNWYDTQTLAVLPPAYVSTVDSGNLSGHLLVLAGACETGMPGERLLRVAARARALALGADFAALYDKRRRLLHIGFDVDRERLDASHYDLLASEARLASLVAIAKGDVPPRHWAALGRPLFASPSGNGVGLKSWSGSMFEYLMPSLVLDEPRGSLLAQATHTAVVAQRMEARDRGTPWGVSESAIAVQDHTLAYQYGPQGVANLALRRTPTDERVVAPYASMMALTVAPQAAADNLAALEALGARRKLGFIEALDYTPYRQPADSKTPFTFVDTYMAHHQAMGFLACAHVLTRGAVHRWAAADPHLRAVHWLLHERAPYLARPLRAAPAPVPLRQTQGQRWQFEAQPSRGALPATHLLGNDRYAVVLRANGSGFSRWQGHGVSRWRDDALRDAHGVFGYVRRVDDPRWMALAARPASQADPVIGPAPESAPRLDEGAHYRAEFHPDRVLLHAQCDSLSATTTVSVSTTDDCELRCMEIHNPGRRPLRLVVALAFEPTLTPPVADEAHPAFSNLFLQARWSARERALFLQRRPRLAHEPALHAVHFLAACDDPLARVQACTDRARWLGRLGQAGDPLVGPIAAFAKRPAESASDEQWLDTGLDPVSVITVELTVPPRSSSSLTFVLAAAFDEDTVRALVDRYQQPASAQRAQGLSDTLARIRLRELRLDVDAWVAWLHLNTLIASAVSRPFLGAAGASAAPALATDRRLLWRLGMGGDRPIVAVWVESPEGMELARSLVDMLSLWAAAGQALDLVFINAEPPSYLAPVQQAFIALGEQAAMRVDGRAALDRRPAIKLLTDRELSPAEQATLRLLARVSLQADGRSLIQHVERLRKRYEDDSAALTRVPRHRVTVSTPGAQAVVPRGVFDTAESGNAFRFEVSRSAYPSRPWINVLANPGFGTQVSESAAGYTWAGNSRMRQVTAWSNDALCDPASEALWLEDLDTGRVAWLGRGGTGAAREVEHGIGYTRMRERQDGLIIELTWCVDAKDAVKQVQVNVSLAAGTARSSRRLRVVAFAEWTLGANRGERSGIASRPYRWLAAPGQGHSEQAVGLALLATQRDAGTAGAAGEPDANAPPGGATAFLCWRPIDSGQAPSGAWIDLDDWTCDRREFFDLSGRPVLPARLGARSGGGLDACAATTLRMNVSPGRPARAACLLGHAPSLEAAGVLAQQSCLTLPADRLAAQLAQWPALLDTIQVRTPDPLFDALVNRWLPYQAIACRLWARAGFYQAGGAFGFRDQLQDAMNLVDRAPALLGAQLRLHASRQFTEGDVQHWWHTPSGAGVRTRMTDDLLWLPLALAHAVERTGSSALLDEQVPFLNGAAVPDDREDLYEVPSASAEVASLYEHGARAIDRSVASLARGPHGLPPIGTGDWNDGMNRVGAEGRGESVWLGWFLCTVIDAFLPLAERRGEGSSGGGQQERARQWREARAGLALALERDGWDGHWYRRAYFDDGTPLGSASGVECRIDLIAQAWAVLSRVGERGRAAEAMASAGQLLWDPAAGLMRLLDPPLAKAEPDAGYIQAYPPGIRENGGQYSHGAVWALMAYAQEGDGAWAWRVFEALSPAHRTLHPERGAVYALEPYVVAGDICSQPPYAGRGGWSWYTGAASWLQRAAVESICGLVIEGRLLTVSPCLPPHWPGVELTVRRQGRVCQVVVVRGEEAATQRSASALVRPIAAGEAVDLTNLPDGITLLLTIALETPTSRFDAGAVVA